MKKLKFIIFMILPGTVCYIYNLYLEFKFLDFIPKVLYIENFYKYLVVYNIIFNCIMVFLAKFFELDAAKSYLNYMNRFFMETFHK